jgi:putative ATP-dependent endonuclease of OLD family
MYLSELKIWNFRKFGEGEKKSPIGEEKNPGLHLRLNSGLNLLVGENDSGKTAIIDAIKMVLFTQSYEYYRLEDEDFHIPSNADEGKRAKQLRIECVFRGFQPSEAKNFLEWIGIERDTDGKPQYYLKVFLIGRRENGRVYRDLKAGSDEQGTSLDGKARDLLRIVYLRPLRDAEFELSPRRNSRLSQILYSHSDFSDKENHPIREAVKKANEEIEAFFEEKEDPETEERKGTEDEEGTGFEGPDETKVKKNGTKIVNNINECLSHFSSKNNPLKSSISIADTNLKSILEQLSLNLSINKAGLGSDNLLFIASELLLLKREKYTGLKLTLIEEIEAHLHPQAQLRLIEYLQRESGIQEFDEKVQLILTTHSPNLASKVKLENLIICKNGKVFNMGSEHTKLEKGDYLFLERFLDVTKANLFFAEGVILVEGDAENLLIPTIAKIIGLPLSKYGVSIINVGSTAFLRYSRIFQRTNSEEFIDTRVAVITDCDVRPDYYYTSENKNKRKEKEQTEEEQDEEEQDEEEQTILNYSQRVEKAIKEKEDSYNELPIKAFISKDWTLEYAIALSDLKIEFYRAVLQGKKIKNSNILTLTEEKKIQVDKKVNSDIKKWTEKRWDNERIAFEIYNNTQLKGKISKAIVAQCFAEILDVYPDQKELQDKLIDDPNFKYIIDAIIYATSGKLEKEASDD